MKCSKCNKRMRFIGNAKSFSNVLKKDINYRINWCGKCELINYKSNYLDKLLFIPAIENKEETGILSLKK